MNARALPRIQLVWAVLFAAVALCGPLVYPELRSLILIAVIPGVLLGLVTLRIGWRLVMEKGEVDYPFANWSRGLLRPFLTRRQVRQLESRRARNGRGTSAAPGAVQDPSQENQRPLGIASLVVGALLVAGMAAAAVFMLVKF